MKCKAILQFAIILVLIVPVTAAVLHVPTDYPDIRSAVDHASDGDEIILADGIYSGEGNRNIDISDSITIRSANGPDNCVIDCNGIESEEYFAFDVGHEQVVLEGLSIINGRNLFGGAIRCNDSRLAVVKCVFENNTAYEEGGAIQAGFMAQVNVMNCSFTGNTARYGGAVFCLGRSNLSVMNSVFANNSSTSEDPRRGGGAIACEEEPKVTLINSELKGNSANGSGGAIFYRGNGSLIIDKCSILDNSAYGNYEVEGAGIYIEGEHENFAVSITDTVIARNVVTTSKESSGGGLYLDLRRLFEGGQVAIRNCTITENVLRADYKGQFLGAGVYVVGNYQSGIGGVMFQNCVISRNLAGDTNNLYMNSMGGGLYCYESRPILLKCRIQNNKASRGSGMFFDTSDTVITNCLVSGNEAWPGDQEGCIILSGSLSNPSVVTNSTIVGNTLYGLVCRGTMPKVYNCIFYNNTNCWGIGQIEGDADVTYSCVQGGWPGEGNIEVDPCFVVPGYWDSNSTPECEDDFWVEGDYHLKADSNCIDAGGVPIWYMDTTDLDDLPRISGTAIDMGVYEYHNTAPVAVAGPDQVVYACLGGLADVELDGSGSYDGDGDELTYKWSWVIDGNNCEANSVAPTISLPVGTHDIELIVHDGTEPSEPDHCIAEVIGGIEGELMIMPRAINCKSRGRWIAVMLTLPAEVTPENVSEEPLKLYPGGINSAYRKPIKWFCGEDATTIFVVFEKREFCEVIEQQGQVEVNVVGELITGQCFYGTGSVKVFK